MHIALHFASEVYVHVEAMEEKNNKTLPIKFFVQAWSVFLPSPPLPSPPFPSPPSIPQAGAQSGKGKKCFQHGVSQKCCFEGECAVFYYHCVQEAFLSTN